MVLAGRNGELETSILDIAQSWGDHWEEGQSEPGDPSPPTKDRWARRYLEQAQEVVYSYTCMCNILRLYCKALERVGSERENLRQLSQLDLSLERAVASVCTQVCS